MEFRYNHLVIYVFRNFSRHLKLRNSKLGHKCLSCTYFSMPHITNPMTLVTDVILHQFNNTVGVCMHITILILL
jgi:hypothetical protein